MNLKEWAEHYIKHHDLYDRNIEKIEDHGHKLLIYQKDDIIYPCLCAETLTDDVLSKLEGHDKALVVTRNLKDNVTFVLQHWKELSGHHGLKIIFANRAKNEKWVLMPHGHAKVADPASLKTGLMAMHRAVPEG